MFNVGDIEILRVEESLGPGFQPNVLLPDWTPAAVEPHLPWLAPTYYDPQQDKLISSIHSWVLKTRHHTILIDTCVGNHKERPGQPRFHMLNRPYMENFAKAGLKVEDIDYVLCTHLHVDHVGWNTRLDNGRWVPTFPNAKYVFSKTDRDYFDPTRGDGGKIEAHARVFNDSVLPILEARQDMTVEGIHKLGDDLTISPAPGHSPGHILITLQSKAARRCSSATSCTTRSRSITRNGAAPSAPIPSRRAAHDAGCWSTQRARAASSIRSTSPARTSGGSARKAARSPICRGVARRQTLAPVRSPGAISPG